MCYVQQVFFSFSEQHITKLGKIQTYLKAMANTKKILKSSLHTKIYVKQALFIFSVHSNGEYKKVVTTKKIVNTNYLAIKLRQYDF